MLFLLGVPHRLLFLLLVVVALLGFLVTAFLFTLLGASLVLATLLLAPIGFRVVTLRFLAIGEVSGLLFDVEVAAVPSVVGSLVEGGEARYGCDSALSISSAMSRR